MAVKKPVGWRGDSYRHSMAARGVNTSLTSPHAPWNRIQAVREASTEDLKKLAKDAEEGQKQILNIPPMGILLYPGRPAKDFGKLARIQAMAEEELARRRR